MQAIKVNIAGVELIIPKENIGMIAVRNIQYEEVEVDSIPNIMEDIIIELSKNQ